MTKSELITKLAARFPQLALTDADVAVNAIFDAMISTLGNGQRIEVRGFGTFKINYRPARSGRNPKTGDKVPVPPKHVPYFKPGKTLRVRVDK